MMNYIWAAIFAFSLIASLITNNTAELSKAILSGANDAVSISLKLLGTLMLWNGIMEIVTCSGLNKKVEKILSPLMKLLFPTYKNTAAGASICANITANLLGLGNAATPLGIEAMRRMKEYSGEEYPDNEMVRFVVINSAALTLIPATAASLREAAGSSSPFSIIIPVWLTGTTALIFGLIAEKLFSKRWK